MSQEVRVQVQFGFEINAEFSREIIEKRINLMLERIKKEYQYPDIEILTADIIDIEEEAEIYGNE